MTEADKTGIIEAPLTIVQTNGVDGTHVNGSNGNGMDKTRAALNEKYFINALLKLRSITGYIGTFDSTTEVQHVAVSTNGVHPHNEPIGDVLQEDQVEPQAVETFEPVESIHDSKDPDPENLARIARTQRIQSQAHAPPRRGYVFVTNQPDKPAQFIEFETSG